MTDFDPLVPRPIDMPTHLPLDGPIDTEAADSAKIFAAPDNPADWPAWRARLAEWRADAWRRLQPDHSAYDLDATRWASTCFSVALVWLWDERLFDHAAQRFTPERFVAGTADFGGFDAVVLWHAYPIIGIDARTQFDFYRDVPGLADLVAWFRGRDIRVFVDYNPWDVTPGHRRDPGSGPAGELDHAAETAKLVTDLDVDGVFLDTMSEGGGLVAALRSLDPPAVLEGETRVPLARIADHQISWAQWFADSAAPGVLRAHWFERRHMQHHTRRWNRDHSEELQSAWINGVGIVVWDAVFGSWVGWNERDRSTLRRMVRVQRPLADVLREGGWTPLIDAAPDAIDAGVYASRWEHGDLMLWTIVNRGGSDYTGRVLDVDADGGSWFDVTAGAQLTAGTPVTVPARGVTGLVRIGGDVPPAIMQLLTAAAADAPSRDAAFPARLPARVAAPCSPSSAPPADAIALSSGTHTVTVRYRLRETGMYGEAPFVEEWKPLPPRLHAEVTEEHTVEIGRVVVARCEVLADDGTPLTDIGLAEARAHAASLGARLPTEFEWQLAAADPAFRRAEPLVWNWTESEHSDGVTRFVILKGGSAHRSDGSEWYFDGGPRPSEFSAKLLLPGLGLDRSPSIGFRLAWDL